MDENTYQDRAHLISPHIEPLGYHPPGCAACLGRTTLLLRT
jgi:hypothetical protein